MFSFWNVVLIFLGLLGFIVFWGVLVRVTAFSWTWGVGVADRLNMKHLVENLNNSKEIKEINEVVKESLDLLNKHKH